MKRTVATFAMTLGAIAVGMMASHVLVAQPTPVTRTTLQQKDLEGVPGKEMIMYVADVAPSGVAGRHLHAGPEVAYVVEGSIVVEPEGQAAFTVKKGESFHNPAKAVHNVRNGSTNEPAKVVVVLIGDKGAAMTTPVK